MVTRRLHGVLWNTGIARNGGTPAEPGGCLPSCQGLRLARIRAIGDDDRGACLSRNNSLGDRRVGTKTLRDKFFLPGACNSAGAEIQRRIARGRASCLAGLSSPPATVIQREQASALQGDVGLSGMSPRCKTGRCHSLSRSPFYAGRDS
jgi:hypothetical protein